MITAIIISGLIGFSLGVISGVMAYECPEYKCECKCNNSSNKQLLKG